MRAIIFLILITSSFSCKKYLDEKSDRAFLIPTTLSDVSLLVQNMNALNFNTVPDLGESNDNIQADSVTLAGASINNIMNATSLWQLKGNIYYTFDKGDSWAKPYHAIYYSNLCLEKLAKIDRTTINGREWDKVYGSALFFRAYHMAQLCWTFAKNYDENNNTDPGIVIKLENDFNIPSVRSTVKESYAQILKDVRASLNYLNVNAETKFLPGKKAGWALFSRVYLSMLKYDSAAYYANLYLQTPNQIMDLNNPVDYNPATPYLSETDKEISFITSFVHGNSVEKTADTAFVNMFADNDIRRRLFFQETSNGLYTRTTLNRIYYKYTPGFTGFRTAELLLTRAECYARANRPDEALADLNMLCSKRYETASFVPYTVRDKDELLTLILLERRKEMACEGVRWMDLKRLNKELRNITIRHFDYNTQNYVELPPNDSRYAIPIPTDIIKMTGMQQN